MLHQAPGQLTIQDVLPDGRVLVTHSTERQAVMIRTSAEPEERDLSWLDWSLLRDISPDGQWLLIIESGEAGGEYASICIRPTDGSPAIQLGNGNATRFSPDGMWILSFPEMGESNAIQLLPTGVGETRLIDTGTLATQGGKWFPDGKSLLLLASDGDGPLRLHRFDIETARATPFGPDETVAYDFELSPDGRMVAARTDTRPMMLYPVDGSDPLPIPGMKPDDTIQAWKFENEAISSRASARSRCGSTASISPRARGRTTARPPRRTEPAWCSRAASSCFRMARPTATPTSSSSTTSTWSRISARSLRRALRADASLRRGCSRGRG
jgi:hypothetical protein